MSSFTTRVVLHDAEWDDYTRLHNEMTERGFSDRITSDDGRTYELPPAEYNLQGSLTRAEVRELAKAAAQRTRRKFAVFVTEATGRTWFGLQQV